MPVSTSGGNGAPKAVKHPGRKFCLESCAPLGKWSTPGGAENGRVHMGRATLSPGDVFEMALEVVRTRTINLQEGERHNACAHFGGRGTAGRGAPQQKVLLRILHAPKEMHHPWKG